jgi:hypothetical protein
MCNNGVFGDPIPGQRKQCYCQSGSVKPKVLKCGDENEDCTCKGNIFYGASIVDGKAADFESMLSNSFSYKLSSGDAPVKCNNANFGDPLPGTPKSCFCDDIGEMTSEQIKSRQDFNQARANSLMAQERAKNLEK